MAIVNGYFCGTAPEGPGEVAGRADLFLLADVLDHVQNDRGLLAALAAAAKPGALFLITVPAEMALWSPHDESHGHYRRYERQGRSGVPPLLARRDAPSLSAARPDTPCLLSTRRDAASTENEWPGFEDLWLGLPIETVGVTAFNARLYPLVRMARLFSRATGRTCGPANTDLALTPKWLNSLLRRIFAGESRRVVSAAQGNQRAAYRRGVSLLALLRRVDGFKNAAQGVPGGARNATLGVPHSAFRNAAEGVSNHSPTNSMSVACLP